MPSADDGGATEQMTFALGAVPLNRPDVSRFIRNWSIPAVGAVVGVLEQRPPPHVRHRWLEKLCELSPDPAAASAQILTADDAMCHVGTHRTDRLVPREFLDDAHFLERNLGGWAPIWFDAIAVGSDASPDDPVLAACERLVDYGPHVASLTASPELVAERLDREFVDGARGLRRSAAVLQRLRADGGPQVVADLVAAARGEGRFADELDPTAAYDELIEQLYRLELQRRHAVAEDHAVTERTVTDQQRRYAEQLGVTLLLKGEYIVGRHRRSTILLAEGLGVVAKQPAPEPEHDIAQDARLHDGATEHWPRAAGDGRMVTARADIAQVVGSTAVERLNTAFGREVRFSAALGLSLEPFESGPTLASLARRDPSALTPQRYDEILVHQLVCEQLGVDNPDWHAANFMVTDDGLVHVDWGAARPIDGAAATPDAATGRLHQVAELAWSFQDAELADRIQRLHAHATDDVDHLDRLRDRARDLTAA